MIALVARSADRSTFFSHVPAHDAGQEPCRQQHGQRGGDAARQREGDHTLQESRNIAAGIGRERQNKRGHTNGKGANVRDVARQVWVRNLGQHHTERNQRRVHGFDEEQAGHAFHVGHDLAASRHHIRQMREL